MKNIFIDGQSGTTGLQIQERLSGRSDINLLKIADQDRKDTKIKQDLLNSADLVILCLPDEAAIESVSLVTNPDVKILDASTAHRVNPDWVYGLPELNPEQRKKIQDSRLIANPGCYPTGFILAINPLVEAGLLPKEKLVKVNAVSGYSGGGHKLMEQYEERAKKTPDKIWSYRPYALNLNHKHLPEMKQYTGMDHLPLFTPSVGHFAQGMLVQIPLFAEELSGKGSIQAVQQCLAEYYADEPCVNVLPIGAETELDAGFLSPIECNGTNRVDLMVFGHDEQVLLVARLDNLGKGAAGAAVQNMNLMLGINEMEGIRL